MKSALYAAVIMTLIAGGCSSNRLNLDSSDLLRDISAVDREVTVTPENSEDILKQYVIEFVIPNPLSGGSGSRSLGENRESVIACRAALLDDFSTEADILYNCRVDSLSPEDSADYREKYLRDNVRDGMFRILISMESGFSSKSMEPDYWSMYLETPDGIMIEPVDRIATPVITADDSLYSETFNRTLFSINLKRNITLYFRNTTFFGENLLGGDNPYLILVISREQQTVARIAWQLNNMPQ